MIINQKCVISESVTLLERYSFIRVASSKDISPNKAIIEERLLKANETITIEKTLGVFIQSSQPLLIQPFNLLTDILMYQTDEHISLTIQALEDTQIFLSVM